MPFARCPLCDDILNIDATLGLNHPVTCSTCLSNLRIVSLDPCELEEVRRPARSSAPQNNPNPGRQGSGNYQRGPGGGPGGKPGQGGNSSGQPAGYPDGRSDSRSGGSNDRRPAQPPRDRRLVPPPPMALPPNPDKLAEVKRPQRWERPKNEEEDFEDTDVDELDELEDKIFRKRGKKNK